MPVGSVVADAFAKVMETAYAKTEHIGGKDAIDALWAMRRSFEDHPLGETVLKMITGGIKTRQNEVERFRQPVDTFQAYAKQHPDVYTKHNYNEASVSQIYHSFPQGHAVRNILDPVMQDRSNHGRTLEDLKRIAIHKSNLSARSSSFGPDSSYLSTVLYPMFHSNRPTDQTLANAWLEIIGQVFRDNSHITEHGTEKLQSQVKTQVAENINTQRRLSGLPEMNINVDPSYPEVSPKMRELETKGRRWTLTALAPWITLVHTADLFKLPATLPAGVLWKTLNTLDDATINAMKTRSGIYVHTLHSIWDNHFMYSTGLLSKISDMPQASAIFHKLYHQPMFNNLRMKQLSIFGTAAYHAAQEWGWQAFQGSEFAKANLRDLNLDPAAIIARRGVLTTNELEEAIFHFTNNSLFIDNPLERSKWAGKSPFFRTAYLLHGYMTKEMHYMGNTLYKALKYNQYGKLAQFAGVAAGLFPFFAAPAIKSLGVLARTGDPKESAQDYAETNRRLFRPRSKGEFAYTYLDLAAHFAGIGVFWNIFRSAVNHRLLASMAGPGPQAATTTGEEWLKTLDDYWKGKNYKPELRKALRDSLHYALPVLGNPIQHYLLPKRKPKFNPFHQSLRNYQLRRYQ